MDTKNLITDMSDIVDGSPRLVVIAHDHIMSISILQIDCNQPRGNTIPILI